MSEWTVSLADQAEAEILDLPAGLQGKFVSLFDMIEESGLLNIPPKRRKHLQGDIWELRVSAAEGTARALYTVSGKIVTVLVVFMKKKEQTPRSLIKLAEKRSREV
jgi:phage-related protein